VLICTLDFYVERIAIDDSDQRTIKNSVIPRTRRS
jgi:hypothetical protein